MNSVNIWVSGFGDGFAFGFASGFAFITEMNQESVHTWNWFLTDRFTDSLL